MCLGPKDRTACYDYEGSAAARQRSESSRRLATGWAVQAALPRCHAPPPSHLSLSRGHGRGPRYLRYQAPHRRIAASPPRHAGRTLQLPTEAGKREGVPAGLPPSPTLSLHVVTERNAGEISKYCAYKLYLLIFVCTCVTMSYCPV